jgi:hypothetical protein
MTNANSIPTDPFAGAGHSAPDSLIPPLDLQLESFWSAGPDLEAVPINIAPPDRPLAILEKLGPSPFERGGFPVVGFLATTYEKVSRYALDRG